MVKFINGKHGLPGAVNHVYSPRCIFSPNSVHYRLALYKNIFKCFYCIKLRTKTSEYRLESMCRSLFANSHLINFCCCSSGELLRELLTIPLQANQSRNLPTKPFAAYQGLQESVILGKIWHLLGELFLIGCWPKNCPCHIPSESWIVVYCYFGSFPFSRCSSTREI